MADSHTFSFERKPDSVPAARETLDRFEDDLSGAALYDASLCLSELVTNAVQHPGHGEALELDLILSESLLRVEVRDPGPGFEPGIPSEGDERDWGLFIVDQLSSRWGVIRGEATVVWFEIDREEDETADVVRADLPAEGSTRAEERNKEIANAVARLRLGGAISF